MLAGLKVQLMVVLVGIDGSEEHTTLEIISAGFRKFVL